MEVYKRPISLGQAQAEIEATPTADIAEGMQIPVRQVFQDKARRGEYSPMFHSRRYVMAGGGAVVVHTAVNIPRSWAVYVNQGAGVGALVQVIAGDFDMTLAAGGHIVFPGRSSAIQLVNTVAAADVTIVELGDDVLQF